jgi:anti-sigma factor RsiW
MPSCTSIDPLVTPYVDGEIDTAAKEALEQHMQVCPTCRARVGRERAVRDLACASRTQLCSEPAPAALHARCAAIGRESVRPVAVPAAAGWRARLGPLALAATLVLIVGGAFLYPLTARSTRVMAAELALDHMKCSLVNGLAGTAQSTAHVEASLASNFGWPARLPERPEQAGLELVGERTCLYGQGLIAHVMYRHEGHVVSVFMLPDAVRKEAIVSVLGHRAAVWSIGGRTFVLMGREPHDELQRMASFVKAGLR